MAIDKPLLCDRLPHKVAACALVAALVFLGVVGLVLPVIPGLLFLAIAAFVAAKHFPALDARLRSYRGVDKHFRYADRFRNLSLADKVQVAGWLCVKMIVDGVAAVASLVTKLASSSRDGAK
jgi:uncharacterized membrane protein YbaN (DUF454 family)